MMLARVRNLNMRVTVDSLRRWQEEGKKIAVYCAGNHGNHFSRIMKRVGLRTDFFLDSDKRKWGMEVDGIPCRDPSGLAGKEDLLVFIAIASEHYFSVWDCVKDRFQIADFTDVIDDIILQDRKSVV